jgi:glycerol-3-phosphate acyltransferase PlsY
MAVSDVLFYISAFLLGSVPFSVLIGKIFYGIDVRRQGSGNPGATNTLRLLGSRAGFSVLVLDMAKGLVPVLLAPRLVSMASTSNVEVQALAGACAILGHIFSPFLRFKGGKGVATSTGVIWAINWPVALAITILFVMVVYFSRYISLGSILSAILFAILECMQYSYSAIVVIFSIGLAVLVIYKHRANINRLLSGTENRFSLKR